MQPWKIWIEQCEAASRIEDDFGTQQAMDYLVGEKFINFLEAADTYAELKEDIPAFVAEIKSLFEPWQLAQFLETARQTKPASTRRTSDRPTSAAACRAGQGVAPRRRRRVRGGVG